MPRNAIRPFVHIAWLAKALMVALMWQSVAMWAQDPYAQEKSPRWAYSAGQSALVTSPTIGLDRTVYVAAAVNTTPSSIRLVAVRPDGSERWSTSIVRDKITDAAPVLSPDGAMLYLAGLNGLLYAVSTDTGKVQWTFDSGHETHSIWGSAAVGADGTVYIGATDEGTEADSTFWAVSPVDGSRLWAVSSAGVIQCSPAVAADGTIYFAGGTQLYAVSHDGEVKWTFPLQAEIWASPAIGADGTVYVGSDVNEFVAVSPEGKEKWRVGIRAGAGAAVGPDETVYVGTIEADGSGKLYALGPNGKFRTNWPISLPARVVSVPAVRSDGVIIFGCNDYTVRAVNVDGSPRWTVSVSSGDVVNTSPAIDTDGSIYIGAGKFLYAYRGSGAPLSEYASWPMFNRDITHQSRAVPPVAGGVLVNLATRGQVLPGTPLIAGFILAGSEPKLVLARAVGPALRPYLSNPLANPVLTLYSAPSFLQGGNDDWEQDADTSSEIKIATAARVGAFPLDAGSKDAAVLKWFAPALNYSAVIESIDQTAGVALAELYDTDRTGSSRLINVSTRGFVGVGDKVLIAGLVIGGEGNVRVLVRGVGPGLVRFAVGNPLQHPTITVFDSRGAPLHSNTVWTVGNWKGDIAGAASLVGAFPLEDTSADSAMMLSLPPGAYTVQLAGVANDTGVGLVEVYALPH